MHTAKDFANEVEVKWCPGCGDHAILKHLQSALAKSGSEPQNTAIISGIGCSSRLPYYMNTYGFHTIHGRALPIASGLKLSRPELEVWVITGDGDALSIGGNHFVHLFRRDIELNVLLFNNQVYGLTKGQFSPTSSPGQYSKSSPDGSTERPLNALKLALSAGATFVSRTFDRDAAHIQNQFIDAKAHKGASLVEILQNCPIFNDGVFDQFLDKSNQASRVIRVEHNKPLIFGADNEFAIGMINGSPKIIDTKDLNETNQWIFDETNRSSAEMIASFGYSDYKQLPLAVGILYRNPIVIRLDEYQDYESMLMNALNKNKFEIF